MAEGTESNFAKAFSPTHSATEAIVGVDAWTGQAIGGADRTFAGIDAALSLIPGGTLASKGAGGFARFGRGVLAVEATFAITQGTYYGTQSFSEGHWGSAVLNFGSAYLNARGMGSSSTKIVMTRTRGGITGGKSTTLYRAVSEAEYSQLMQTGKFAQGPNSLGGKFFAESATDASTWGMKLNGPGKFRIVSAELPTDIANQLMRWEKLDAIGPARYAELEQLTGAIVREVK